MPHDKGHKENAQRTFACDLTKHVRLRRVLPTKKQTEIVR